MDTFKPRLLILLIPVVHENIVTIRVGEADLAAAHIWRKTNRRYIHTFGFELFAKCRQVGCVHTERHCLFCRVYGMFGAQEHQRAAFAMDTRPAERRATIGVDDLESQPFIKADRGLDIRDMQEGRAVSSSQRHSADIIGRPRWLLPCQLRPPRWWCTRQL